MRAIRKLALGLGTAILAIGIVIHLPPVRGYLAAHGHHGGGICPLGYGSAPVQPDSGARGSFEALGFELGKTTTTDVTDWARGRGIECTTKHGGSVVECSHVLASMVGEPAMLGLTSAWFRFDAGGALASIQTARRDRAASPVAEAFERLALELGARAGKPRARSGSAAAEDLARGQLRQAMIEFRAPGYRAVVRATNMGDGFVLTEDYARAD